MPVLYFTLGVGSGEDISGFVVAILGAPEDVGKWGFRLTGYRKGQVFLLCVEHLHRSVLTSYLATPVPAAMYLS